MNIYAASDLHGNLLSVPRDADLIMLAGDICPDFRPYGSRGHGMVDKDGVQQAQWLDTEFRTWLEFHQVPVVAIWGNHDFVGEHPFLVPKLPWTLLKDSETTIRYADITTPRHYFGGEIEPEVPYRDGQLRIYGTPWVPGLPYWAFYGTPPALSARAEMIPEGIDILMTHGPPRGHGDFIPTSEKQANKYGNFGGMNVGDPSLNEAIARTRPKAVLCGHIHEARGRYPLNDSMVYNVAAVNEDYVLHERHWVKIEL